jgi:hypothetical protein
MFQKQNNKTQKHKSTKTKSVFVFLCFCSNQRGIAALLTIIIVGAATLIMAYSASLLGLGELEMGYASQQGGEALSVADGCMEEAFRHLKLNSSYSGGSLNLGNGSCTITIVPSGNNRTITITGTVGDYNKKIEAGITLSTDAIPVITVNSWEELSS